MSDRPTLRPPAFPESTPTKDWQSRPIDRVHSAVVSWVLEATRIAIGRAVDHMGDELREILLNLCLETYDAASKHVRAVDKRVVSAYFHLLRNRQVLLPTVSAEDLSSFIGNEMSTQEVEAICRCIGIPLQES